MRTQKRRIKGKSRKNSSPNSNPTASRVSNDSVNTTLELFALLSLLETQDATFGDDDLFSPESLAA